MEVYIRIGGCLLGGLYSRTKRPFGQIYPHYWGGIAVNICRDPGGQSLRCDSAGICQGSDLTTPINYFSF